MHILSPETPQREVCRTWQAGGGSFLLLPRRHALSSRWLWTFNHNTCENRSLRSCYQFSLHATSLSRHVAVCTALVCGAQCSMPVRLCHWQNQTSNVCSRMTGQWSDRSAMSGRKTLSRPSPMSYLRGLTLRIWTSFWRREDSAGMDVWNALMVQSRQPFTYRLRERVGLGSPRWHGSSWQRGIAESGSSRLSTLMIEICGDLVWYLPCVQQASYLEGGPLMLMLPLYLHINQKSDYDMKWWQLWRFPVCFPAHQAYSVSPSMGSKFLPFRVDPFSQGRQQFASILYPTREDNLYCYKWAALQDDDDGLVFYIPFNIIQQ